MCKTPKLASYVCLHLAQAMSFSQHVYIMISMQNILFTGLVADIDMESENFGGWEVLE